MRDSCIFYRSFYEAINSLPEQNRLEIYEAIFAYSLDFKNPELKGISLTVFTLIKPHLDSNKQKWENGKKAKQKQNRSKTEAKQKQSANNVDVDVNVDKDNNVDVIIGSGSTSEPAISNIQKLDLRKKEFYQQLKPLISKYPAPLLRSFFNYWTEPNKSETKMRFELEKTWNLKSRLARWAANDKGFDNSVKPTEIENPYK